MSAAVAGASPAEWFYRKPETAGESRLPDEWEGAYIFGEWMRNWVATARFDQAGKLVKAERVLDGLTFKRPADFKIGPDGALYIAECGDRWTGNTESQITRVTYHRGNRPPQALFTSSRTAGKLPLEVAFSMPLARAIRTVAISSSAGILGDGKKAEGAKAAHAFTTMGMWPVTLTVTDRGGCCGDGSGEYRRWQ